MPVLRSAAGVILAASLLAGCGGGDGPSGGPPADAAAAPSAAPGVAPPAPAPGAVAPPAQPGPGRPATPPATEAKPRAAAARPSPAALRVAAQRYADALLAGDFLAVVPLLDETCTDKDRDALAGAMGVVKRIAKGATMTITGVRVVGDAGAPTRYRLSANPSPRLRAVVRQAFRANPGSNPWRWVHGQWLNTGPCTGPGFTSV